MSKNQRVTVSEFYCTKCGRRGVPISRRIGHQREAGHLKKLYCIYCKEEVNHAEVRPFGEYNYEDFQKEFKLGRFLEDGTKVPISDLISCTNIECNYNVNGKCWNSNYSFNCRYRRIKENG